MPAEAILASGAAKLPQTLSDAVNAIHDFCNERATGCHGCPLFNGMQDNGAGCIYRNLIPAEISSQRIIDMNSYNDTMQSGDFPAVGSCISICGKQFTILDYIEDCVVVFCNEFVRLMGFSDGETDSDYANSAVRRYLNTSYLNAVARVIGEDNIVPHRVDTTPASGTMKNEGVVVTDRISLITLERVKKYRKVIRFEHGWWWTATLRDDIDMTEEVVRFSGATLDFERMDQQNGGVRPFMILKLDALSKL